MHYDDVRLTLRQYILDEILAGTIETIEDDEPLVSAGLIDSFYVVRLAVHVEDIFGVRIPDEDLTQQDFDTLAQMTAVVVRRLT